jgi:Fe-S-cluster containining protein
MKQEILQIIYSCFANWADRVAHACRKGCSTCCTQSVTMTAEEGKFIMGYLRRNEMLGSLTDFLNQGLPSHELTCTTNEYAGACLQGRSIDPGVNPHDRTCPFLRKDLCSIYPARPFSCRCFASQVVCGRGVSASVPDYYLSGATAVSQIIEHLDQGKPWGNMLHLLAILSGHPADQIPDQIRSLTSRPLPGFLISDTDYPHVAPLIEDIFGADINGKNVEDILNGR